MTKETKIGKKDVAACNHWEACDYYKQLKRLEQENKDLQERLAEVQNTYLEARTAAKEALQEDKKLGLIIEEYKSANERLCDAKVDDFNFTLTNYRSALEEIRNIADKFNYWNSNLPMASEIIDEVKDKINEVLQ